MISTSEERGQVTVLVLGLALVCFAVAGLAVDGTRAFLARRTLQSAADGAAAAGASEIDVARYYRTGGRSVVLDSASARQVAGRWLARGGIDTTASVSATANAVSVSLREDIPTTWLGLVGIDRIAVGVTARSRPLAGRP